jgi:succinylglutamate desuccinylase
VAQDPQVIGQLEEFLERAAPGPFLYEACHYFEGVNPDAPHVVFGFCIHGNEHGSLPALLQLQRELAVSEREVSVTLLLGNVDALRRDVRFVEEDFNRVFTFDRPAESLERRRAERVRPILDRTDFFLDFHQTQTKTKEPFYTFPWFIELGDWARALGLARVGLTRPPTEAFSPGLCCLDEYVRARGQVGLTIELGTRGQDPAQAALALTGARRTLRAFDEILSGRSTLTSLAAEADEIDWYESAHVIRSRGNEIRLRPGLENWTLVSQGETLSEVGSPLVTSPFAAAALFPKYPGRAEAAPPELLRLARPVTDPTRKYGAARLI